MPEIQLQPRASNQRPVCVSCRGELGSTDAALACTECNVPLHWECWRSLKRCPTAGCTGKARHSDRLTAELQDWGPAAPPVFAEPEVPHSADAKQAAPSAAPTRQASPPAKQVPPAQELELTPEQARSVYAFGGGLLACWLVMALVSLPMALFGKLQGAILVFAVGAPFLVLGGSALGRRLADWRIEKAMRTDEDPMDTLLPPPTVLHGMFAGFGIGLALGVLVGLVYAVATVPTTWVQKSQIYIGAWIVCGAVLGAGLGVPCGRPLGQFFAKRGF